MTLSEFKEQEESKMTWWDRVCHNYPDIKSTHFFAQRIDYTFSKERKVFRSYSGSTVVIVGFILIGLRFLWMMFGLLLSGNDLTLVLIFFVLFSIAIIGFAIWYGFVDPKTNFTVKVDKFGITARGKSHIWENIESTYILQRQEGKTTNFYLILFIHNQVPVKLNFFNFGASHYKVSAAVEHYKSISA